MLRARRFAALALLALVLPLASDGADLNKTLRVTFPTAETGFDPVKVSDVYSGQVIDAIFDPLLTYDYLARPARLVPNVAETLPLVADDGRTYTLKIRQGIYFAADPVFKGVKRELTAGGLRVLDQAVPRPEKPLAVCVPVRRQDRRARRTRRAGEKNGPIRLRRQGGGARSSRPVHAAHPAPPGRLQFLPHARFSAGRRGRARSDRGVRRRHQLAPRRNGPLSAEAVRALLEDRAGGEPGLPRQDLGFRARRRSAGCRDRGKDEGQEAARDRDGRNQRHGRDPEPLARLPERRKRISSTSWWRSRPPS